MYRCIRSFRWQELAVWWRCWNPPHTGCTWQAVLCLYNDKTRTRRTTPGYPSLLLKFEDVAHWRYVEIVACRSKMKVKQNLTSTGYITITLPESKKKYCCLSDLYNQMTITADWLVPSYYHSVSVDKDYYSKQSIANDWQSFLIWKYMFKNHSSSLSSSIFHLY